MNNPGNSPPDVRLFAPVGGEIWTGTQNILWFARDPDEDSLTVDLRYSYDGKRTWQALARDVPNTGTYSWNTYNYLNSNQYYLAVVAWDGQFSRGDTSASAFTVDNFHPPPGQVVHDSGGATTVEVNPYVADPPRITGHRYRIRFLPIRKDSTAGNEWTAFYGYDLWDLDLGQRVITDRVTRVSQDNTLIYDNSPVVDGLVIEMRHRVNRSTFGSGTVTITPPYNYPALGDTTPESRPGRFGFNQVAWPFRGTLVKLTWHRGTGSKGDSLWLEVRDSTNHVDIQPETLTIRPNARISGWCFGGNLANRVGKLFMDSTMANWRGQDSIPTPNRYPATWLTLCGRRYWFNGRQGGYDGRVMPWPGGVPPINDGDVWLIQPFGDRPPHDGDVYTFQTQVGVEEAFNGDKFSFWLGQAYPNPASAGNLIPFGLERKGRTSLKVYNVTGALVRTIVDEEMETGRYQISWNGRNGLGKPVASGVYLYRLEAPSRVAVMKMVVLR